MTPVDYSSSLKGLMRRAFPYMARAHLQAGGARQAQVAVQDVGRGAQHVLPLLVLDQVQELQRADDVVRLDRRDVAQLADADRALALAQHLRPAQRAVWQRLMSH